MALINWKWRQFYNIGSDVGDKSNSTFDSQMQLIDPKKMQAGNRVQLWSIHMKNTRIKNQKTNEKEGRN